MDVAAPVRPGTDSPDQQAPPHPAGPCAFVIFGAGGDLTKRLLVPALYNLAEAHLLPDEFAVIGVARADMSDESFRDHMGEALRQFATGRVESAVVRDLIGRFSYLRGDFDDADTYRRLADKLSAAEKKFRTGGNCLFYLATPPDVFALVAGHLAQADLAREGDGRWRRIVIEKPFGADLESARELDRRLLKLFAENQIYRIDHYLGKETVQNIMVLRFANGLFEPLWNRDHIDHVQITVAETLTVENRGKFYDHTGALRDMVPNHLFQLLALTAMEPPARFDPDAVRSEKAKAVEAVHPLTSEDVCARVVRAQYRAGTIEGERVPAYREAAGVDPESMTETYVAMRLMIDNWRWAGVPFYLRTGKALAARKTHIVIQFKAAPFALFRDTPVERLAQNLLVLRIQPDEGAALQFNAKIPGPAIHTGGVRMDFKYRDYFDAAPNTGYETLIYDCMVGDATLFQRADNIESGWQVVQPILDAWRAALDCADLAWYAAGSEGPQAADELIARDGRAWRSLA
ncbi:MAG TPA: glucose-6-phosphate dehydrogenase [Xanthobacteraceae bacterium]|jgi:glucose-6-phosphate 1-dehydrogenase|nr:glucose-6-phosphate dehydrogenase [Xanthobacteraceae bacterium]